ncbi:MAG: NAD(P)/FAD-dependent oxidoreductase [Isosphaerales bacterium]
MTTNAGARPVIVIGGGVIGAACAYSLMRAGRPVTLIERGAFGRGSSHGNCGLVCPSHILPLAEPGMVSKGIKSLFKRNSPFAIKPRFDPALWSWLLKFAGRCNERDMIAAGRGIQPLLQSSLLLYRELIERESLDCEFESRGLLLAYRSKQAMDAYAATDRLMSESFHCPARRYDGDAVSELEPALRAGLAGGWYYHDDSHLRPDKLMRAWRRVLEAGGVTIREHCAFRGFQSRGGRVVAADTAGGELPADLFIVAAGAWTPLLNEHLGCRIPIQPGKGYSLTMPRPALCPKIPLIFPETRVAVTPFQSGYRLGSTMEFAGYDESIRPERLRLLRDGATGYLHEPYCEPVQEEWYGWRPMTYDSLPIIDRSPKYENVIIAAGHNMLGLSMAPATGRLVAELAEGAQPHIDPAPYRAGRF